MKFFVKVKWFIFNCLSYTPVPFKFLAFIETLSAMLQGKGWGSSTIKHEVSACLSILKYPPKILIDIGSLFRTDHSIFYISIGLGKVSFNGTDIFIMSPVSPLSQRLIGLNQHDSIEFNGITHNILSIC